MKIPIALDATEIAILLTAVRLGCRNKEAPELPLPILEMLDKIVDKLTEAGYQSIQASKRAR